MDVSCSYFCSSFATPRSKLSVPSCGAGVDFLCPVKGSGTAVLAGDGPATGGGRTTWRRRLAGESERRSGPSSPQRPAECPSPTRLSPPSPEKSALSQIPLPGGIQYSDGIPATGRPGIFLPAPLPGTSPPQGPGAAGPPAPPGARSSRPLRCPERRQLVPMARRVSGGPAALRSPPRGYRGTGSLRAATAPGWQL